MNLNEVFNTNEGIIADVTITVLSDFSPIYQVQGVPIHDKILDTQNMWQKTTSTNSLTALHCNFKQEIFVAQCVEKEELHACISAIKKQDIEEIEHQCSFEDNKDDLSYFYGIDQVIFITPMSGFYLDFENETEIFLHIPTDYPFGIAMNDNEKKEVINEANKIYNVKEVIPSIYLVTELSRNKI